MTGGFELHQGSKNIVFIIIQDYLLELFHLKVQKDKIFEFVIMLPVLFVNLYDLIPELCIRTLLSRNTRGIEFLTVTIIDN
jgi:hypothetical protein